MRIKINYIFFPLFLILLMGCISEEDLENKVASKGYEIAFSINGFEGQQTRAIRAKNDDHWTYKNFQRNDKVGFYSLYGNEDAPGGNGSFNNVPLTYGTDMSNGRASFLNSDINFNTENFVQNSAFYYFPYGENVDYDPNHGPFVPRENYGIELRIADGGYEKCEDVLWIYAPRSVINSMNFNQAFCSIVILRGEGFENPKDPTIKVVMKQGFSHAVIEDEGEQFLKYIRLIYLDGYTFNGNEKSEEDCRVWEAWPGDPYKVDVAGPYFGDTFDDAYYVVLPTSRKNKPTVDYIELCDNEGRFHKITNFSLYNANKVLEHNQRYPVVIKMDGLEPTVYPIRIEPWEDAEEIIDERAAGIGTETDFRDWVNNYNEYINLRRPQSYESILEKYGDKTEMPDQSVKWTFYLNEDLDLEQILSNQQTVINLLDDTLEGNQCSVSNIKLSSSDKPAFIGELGQNGEIRNISFKGVNIINTNADTTLPTGGLIGLCKGVVSQCNVDGVVSGNGPVGLIAAETDGAVIEDCRLSGLLIGASTAANGVTATTPVNSEIVRINTSGLIFPN